jgi:hypothetical protein
VPENDTTKRTKLTKGIREKILNPVFVVFVPFVVKDLRVHRFHRIKRFEITRKEHPKRGLAANWRIGGGRTALGPGAPRPGGLFPGRTGW